MRKVQRTPVHFAVVLATAPNPKAATCMNGFTKPSQLLATGVDYSRGLSVAVPRPRQMNEQY